MDRAGKRQRSACFIVDAADAMETMILGRNGWVQTT
jgi:hypothetical protein